MKIRFEGTPLCSEQLTGIGIHERQLCLSMMNRFPEDEYVFTYFSGVRGRKCRKRKIMEQYLSEHSRIKEFPLMTAGLYRLIQGVLPVPFGFFFPGKSDITHFFNFLIPPGVKGKKVVTVHDLAFVRYPETVAYKTRKVLSLRLKKTLKKADHIFVASAFTGAELTELYGVPKDRMTVVYAGVDRELFKPRESAQYIEVLEKRGLTDKGYFFYLGTIEPRKNIKRMILAYADTVRRLEAEGKEIMPLVLGGKLGWYYDEILESIKSEGIEDKIILAGYLSDEEKASLYCGARAFVFPSLYEGFGIPVLEAMACGTPVLTASVSSLPEVAGDCAVMCDPLDTHMIADGFYALATDDELCLRLSAQGYERSKQFSWDNTAALMRKVYEKVVNGD